MATELSNDKSPLDANLEKVLPGIKQWHNINESSIKRLHEDVERLDQTFNEGLQRIVHEARVERAHAGDRMHQAFSRFASAFAPSEGQATNPYKDFTPVHLMMDDEEIAAAAATTTDDNSPPPSPPEADPKIRKPMVIKHSCLMNLYNEWHGLQEFEDDYGGVGGREDRFGSKWRKGLVTPQQISRTKRVIVGIREYGIRQSLPSQQAVMQLEDSFAECKHSVKKFVERLQSMGLVDKRETRVKKKQQ